ncbi:MAG: DUF1735 and LamG domain-containing protein [Prevotella sp.]|jgi:hypothetical protein|nr:DUF1735 and LamG domain-containing protein [Prevotella sp.]
MKQYSIIYLIIIASALTFLSGCSRVDETESNFDNVAYIEKAKNVQSEFIGVRNKDVQVEKTIQAALALPTDKEIRVTFKVDKSLVETYNVTNLAECEALPDEFYELSGTETFIPAGEVRSTEIQIQFKNLSNLPRSKTFILPISIDNANIGILNGAKTFYYLLRKGAPITIAANIDKSALYVPTMTTTGVASGLNNLTKVTLETLVRAQLWGGSEAGISTLMGIESYFLIRFGDSNYEDQIQVAAASFGGNWPAKDAAKRLPKGEWLHIALTYDLGTHEMILYVNGKVQAKTIQGTAATMDLTRISGTNPTNRFFIGKSWSDNRYFHGEICETRIWNVVRTQEELNTSKYEVNPTSGGLLAYWKFDEGEGTVIHDYTGNGNDLSLAPLEGSGGGFSNPFSWVAVELGEE